MTIELYGIPMSRASRCLWMLEELGVAYENVPVRFLGEVQNPEFLAINPNGRAFTVADLNAHAVLGWATSLGRMSFDATPNVWPAGSRAAASGPRSRGRWTAARR
jgi:glutathione S-transferase